MYKSILPHPPLVHFPLAFWIGSLGCDILYAINRTAVFAQFSCFCIIPGLITFTLAVPSQLADYADHHPGQRLAA